MRLLSAIFATFVATTAFAGDDMGEGEYDGELEGLAPNSAVNNSGVVTNNLTLAAGIEVLFSADNNPTRPSVQFEPNTGWYASSDGTFRFSSNGLRWITVTGIRFSGVANLTGVPLGDSWELTNQSSTATVPSLCPRGDVGGDTDTGAGGGANGEVSIISDASEKLTLNAAGMSTPFSTKTLGVGVTTFAVTHAAQIIDGNATGGNTIATITGCEDGSFVRLLFVDSSVIITDDDTHVSNSVDISAAFTSADDTVLELMCALGSWYEVLRSVN